MRISVILSTYRQPAWLAKVLLGYTLQDDRDFEVVIADDGSGPETRAVVERFVDSGLELTHVWHPDRGFQKSEILNRAMVASRGDYLLFSDGDCIPRRDFVSTHRRVAEPGRFLSGGGVKLPREISEAIGEEDIRSGRFADLAWLRSHGFRPGRRALRLLPPGLLPTALDLLTPTSATWNGLNASTWREPAFEVNGFEAAMQYGGQDRAFGERLENLGLRGQQVRHRAVCLHLWHERPYKTEESLRKNRAIRTEIRKTGDRRAEVGIAELEPAPGWEEAHPE